MKNKNLIVYIIAIFLVLLILSFLYLDYSFRFSKEPEYLTTIAELYSYFTDPMKEIVDSRLQVINCKPEKYYYSEPAFCFICDEIHPCFDFGWVHRTGGQRINPKGKPYLINYDKLGVEIADFYKDGLASLFECVEKDNETLLCVDDVVFVKDYDDVKMILNDEHKLEHVSNRICTHYGNPSPDCRESVCSCGNKQIIFTSEQLFIYDIVL